MVLQGQSSPPTYSTNRIDINVDGLVDFELVTKISRETVPGPGGFNTYTSTQVRLVPLGSNRLLVAPGANQFSNVPVFEGGATIGPASVGQIWTSESSVVLDVIEPFGLNGPLAPVLIGAPGTLHLGVALGAPESPVYAWIAFNRMRGASRPMSWGYSRTAGNPVGAGDPATAPLLKALLKRSAAPNLLRLVWEPGFANVVVEESESGGTWTPVANPADPGFIFGELSFTQASHEGVPHLFRVRYAP